MGFVGSWHQKCYTDLDEALTTWFANSDATDKIEIWNNNNALILALDAVYGQTLGNYKGPQTIDQFSFLHTYGKDLEKAELLTWRYKCDMVDSDAEDDRVFPDETNVKRIGELVNIHTDVTARLERQLKAPVKLVVPLLKRKRDLVYFAYFLIHIPVIIFVDAAALLESQQRPTISNTFFKLQSEGYGDQFFAKGDIQFFNFFRLMEIFLHLPISVWALRALPRDDYKVPLILLPFAIQVAVTTATCIYDYASWTEIGYAAKWNLTTLYGPYLILSLFMMVDMYGRIKRSLGELQLLKGTRKTVRSDDDTRKWSPPFDGQ